MRTFLKYAAVFAAGLFAPRVALMGLEKLDKALEGVEDVPHMGTTSKYPTAPKKD